MQAQRDAEKVDRWTKANRSAISLSAKAIAGFTAGLLAASPLMRSLLSDMGSAVGELVDELLILSGVEGGLEGIADSLFDLSDSVRSIHGEIEEGETNRGGFLGWLRDIPLVGGPAVGVLSLLFGTMERFKEGDFVGAAAGAGLLGFFTWIGAKGINKVKGFLKPLAAAGGLRWALLRVAGAAGIANAVLETLFPGHTQRAMKEVRRITSDIGHEISEVMWPNFKQFLSDSKSGVTDAAEWWGARWHRGFERMKGGAGTAIDWIGDRASALSTGAWRWGRDLGDNFASGLRSARNTVGNAARSVRDEIASWISFDIPMNDREAMKWGKHAVQFFGRGIQRELGALNRTLAASPLPFGGQPAPPMPAPQGGGGGTTIQVSVEQGAVQMQHTGAGAPDMRRLAEELARILGDRLGVRG